MKIVGICRFSLVGRGDWRETRGLNPSEIEAMADERAAMLFAPERMEQRFDTFEYLTLASMRAQTDQDFTFIVLASTLMPEAYRQRLQTLCDTCPQVVLRFFPVTSVEAAHLDVFKELDIPFLDTLQFRLDDDDCVCVDYVEIMRKHTEPLMQGRETFAVSLTGVLFSALHGPKAGVYDWPVRYHGVGVAVRHHKRSIFRFGHYALAERFLSLTIPRGMALVTHGSSNDTEATSDKRMRKRGKVRMTDNDIGKAVEVYFPFLTKHGQKVAGLLPKGQVA